MTRVFVMRAERCFLTETAYRWMKEKEKMSLPPCGVEINMMEKLSAGHTKRIFRMKTF